MLGLSWWIAYQQKKPAWKSIGEHLLIVIIVVVLARFVGLFVSTFIAQGLNNSSLLVRCNVILEKINDMFRKHLGINPEMYINILDNPNSMIMHMDDGRDLSFSQYFYKFLDREKVPILAQNKYIAKDYPSEGFALGYMHSIIMGKLERDEGGCVFEHKATILPFEYRISAESNTPVQQQLEQQLRDIVLSEEFLPWQATSPLQFSRVNITYKYMFLHPEMLSHEYLEEIGFQR